MDLIARPEMGHIMNGLRVLSVAGFFVMSNFTTVRHPLPSARSTLTA